MRNESLIIVALWIGTIIGFIVGISTAFFGEERAFSKCTLNYVEQNMSLKQMAFDKFPNDYKLRFDDWHNLSIPNQLKEKE
jgi:sensor domain CHASE-containing protein